MFKRVLWYARKYSLIFCSLAEWLMKMWHDHISCSIILCCFYYHFYRFIIWMRCNLYAEVHTKNTNDWHFSPIFCSTKWTNAIRTGSNINNMLQFNGFVFGFSYQFQSPFSLQPQKINNSMIMIHEYFARYRLVERLLT